MYPARCIAALDSLHRTPRKTGALVMKLRSIGLATAICWILSSIGPARAGYWNYGCKGNLADKETGHLGDSTIAFDRNFLVVMPADLGKGDIKGLEKSGIYAFEADRDPMVDGGPIFKPEISFTRTAYPDQKIVLTEKSKKTISERHGHLGTRETSTGHYRIIYRYKRTGWQFDLPEADIVMDCVEKEITAP
jgi:hypothetical protein